MNFSNTKSSQKATSRIRELSADEETRRLAFVRERALRDEVSFLNDAKREGEQLGIEKGKKLGIEKNKRETAHNLLKLGVLNDEQIAEVTGLAVDEIAKLRIEDKH
ncbi:hypothetical protein VRRI112168_12880 [Vreelandella rituensis]|uniref:Rpn family recombination-promoting nuclease/putative transposase n=1 Tax=Vreelandella rituensis TaxID=2282306 RepID=A0A368U0D8_9GAMM|nr:hypothetical protein [Halomonas rituensis]RCV89957.1 hypothetical protein DU506_12110 [Halomonas rituensis]